MIRFEDDFPLENRFDVIIPISFSLRGGEISIEAYECVRDIAEEFEQKFGSDPFSADSLEWLDGNLRSFCADRGYEPDSAGEVMYEYLYDGEKRDMSDVIMPSSVMLASDHGFESALECDIDLGEDPFGEYPFEYVGFGTVIDGVIVSVCSENPQLADENETEVGVETHPDHRGQGYAASNLASACDYLARRGQKVFYKCEESNIASRKTAEKAGMMLYSKSYHYPCYLIEE